MPFEDIALQEAERCPACRQLADFHQAHPMVRTALISIQWYLNIVGHMSSALFLAAKPALLKQLVVVEVLTLSHELSG